MHAFEEIVAALLNREGYWVRPTFKVELSREEKQRIGRPSSPRWELDLLGYHVGRNHLLMLECKSYIDSTGVRHAHLAEECEVGTASGYKLFVEAETQRVVTEALVRQLTKERAICDRPTVQLGLAAGRIKSGDEQPLRELFDKRGWLLWTPKEIAHRIRAVAKEGYENSVASMLAKILVEYPE